jgi:serine phosphatase RsbU (regulator of sigma subunit)
MNTFHFFISRLSQPKVDNYVCISFRAFTNTMENKIRFILIFWILSLAGFAQQIPEIRNGVLDFRNSGAGKYKEVSFSGEWEFYWEQFLEHKDFSDSLAGKPTALIKVPNTWNSLVVDGQTLPAHGYATYRIKVLVDNADNAMAIKLGSISTAFKAYVNDSLISSAGQISMSQENSVPDYASRVVVFQPPADTFNIIFQVSNHHYCKSGLWNNFSTIGDADVVKDSWSRNMQLLMLLLGCIGIFGIYHFGFFLLNRSLKSALYFSLICLVIGARAVMVKEIFLIQVFPSFNWFLLIKLEYLTLMAGVIVLVLFINDVFQQYINIFFSRLVIIINSLFAFIVLVTSVNFFTGLLIYFQAGLLLGVGYSIFTVVRGFLNREVTAQIIVVGLIAVMATIVNDILYVGKIIDTAFLTTYGFIFFIVSQSFMLSYLFQKMYKETIQLAENLEDINKNLEQKVADRTCEIKGQNLQLQERNEEIKAQRDSIEKQHAVVKKQKQVITDSINYAQRIQSAVLPSDNKFAGHLKEHFILYKPRDIVSGDFYWFSVKDGKAIIVAADCTGHGVPGAFMSMLGMAFLAEISRMPEVNSPAEILEFMRDKVKQSLNQYDKTSLVKEGMDMALCIYDPKERTLEFAGAYSPLYIIRNGEIIIHKGDRQPVAVYLKEHEFSNKTITVQPNDRFYMFSDGYADQISGDTKRKFMVRKFRELLLKIHQLPMAEQKKQLETTLNKWQAGGPQIDDILVIGFQV